MRNMMRTTFVAVMVMTLAESIEAQRQQKPSFRPPKPLRNAGVEYRESPRKSATKNFDRDEEIEEAITYGISIGAT